MTGQPPAIHLLLRQEFERMATAYKLQDDAFPSAPLGLAAASLAKNLSGGLRSIATAAAGHGPTRPDADILDAYERIRAQRVYAYSFDDLPPEQRPVAAIEAAENATLIDENRIWGSTASSIEGVICRLLLLIPDIDQSRWVDETLVSQGLDALLARQEELDGNARQVALSVLELRRLVPPAPGPHVGWLREYQAARGYLNDVRNPEDTPAYHAAADTMSRIERACFTTPALDPDSAVAKLFIAARVGADGATLPQAQADALVSEAESALGFCAGDGPAVAASSAVATAFERWKNAELAGHFAGGCPDEVMDMLCANTAEAVGDLMRAPSLSAEDLALKMFTMATIMLEPELGEPPLAPKMPEEEHLWTAIGWRALIPELYAFAPAAAAAAAEPCRPDHRRAA